MATGFEAVVSQSRLPIALRSRALDDADEFYPYVAWIVASGLDAETLTVLSRPDFLRALYEESRNVALLFVPCIRRDDPGGTEAVLQTLERALPKGFGHWLCEPAFVDDTAPPLVEATDQVGDEVTLSETPGMLIVARYRSRPLWVPIHVGGDPNVSRGSHKRPSVKDVLSAMRTASAVVLGDKAEEFLRSGHGPAVRSFREENGLKNELLREFERELKQLTGESSTVRTVASKAAVALARLGLLELGKRGLDLLL